MAKQQQKQQQRKDIGANSQADSKTTSTGQGTTDAVALLKGDHRKVEGLFRQYESATSSEAKASLARQICNELIVHTKLEEELFYAACREKNVEHDLLDEAQVEHDSAKILVAELMTFPVSSEYYDAKVRVLSEYIKHHVGEEEKPGTGIFAKAQAAGLDMNALGSRLQARKQQLTGKAESEGFSPPRPRSLGTRSFSPYTQEDETMPRYERERDEQGRFTSDDDYGSTSRGRYASSGSGNYRERDEQGRFMSDDDEGERGGRSYGRSGRDYDSGRGQRGGFGDPPGYPESSREGYGERGYDEDRGSRAGYSGRSTGGGRGGFGDPQGYSGASREGWEERGYSRSRGRGGYDEDEERGGSRGGGGRGRGQGGWFSDSQGHSEASRQGWEERGGSSRSSRGGRDYDESRSRSSGNGDHRGWYGDTRGHADAARRGWQNR